MSAWQQPVDLTEFRARLPHKGDDKSTLDSYAEYRTGEGAAATANYWQASQCDKPGGFQGSDAAGATGARGTVPNVSCRHLPTSLASYERAAQKRAVQRDRGDAGVEVASDDDDAAAAAGRPAAVAQPRGGTSRSAGGRGWSGGGEGGVCGAATTARGLRMGTLTAHAFAGDRLAPFPSDDSGDGGALPVSRNEVGSATRAFTPTCTEPGLYTARGVTGRDGLDTQLGRR